MDSNPQTPIQPQPEKPVWDNITAGGPLPAQQPQASQPLQQPPKKSPKWRLILSILVLLGAAGGTAAWWLSNNDSNKPEVLTAKPVVKIGLLAPMSGDNISVGADRKRAIALARKDLNLQNVDIQVVEKDSDCDPDKATKALQEMVTQDGVIAVIGDDCSTSTLAAAQEAEKNHVVLISAAATSPAISTAGDYIFRTVPSDAQQGVFAANLMSTRGYKKIAILHEDGAYGEGLAASFETNLKKKGVTLVDNQVFVAASTEVTAQLQHIKDAKPEALYIISGDLTADTAIMLKIKQLAIDADLFGSEALKNSVFIQDAGEAAEGLTITSLTDGVDTYKAKYRAAYNLAAGDYTAQTYDAYTAIALAVKDGARSGEQIKSAFSSLSFDGASGNIKFDANGDVSGSYEVVVVKNKQFVVVTQ